MQEENLKKYWTTLIQKYKVPSSLTDEIYEKLTQHYNSPQRYYHNLTHIEAMLTTIETYKADIENYDAVSFAVWFHDIIYNPLKTDNEIQSALYAKQALQSLNFPLQTLSKIHDLIVATANHMNIQNTEDFDTKIFLDTDLKILGSSRNSYINYMQQIRKEYQWIPDLLYNPGRKKVLKKFLQQEFLYRTESFRVLYEKQAKENILFELEQL
jgi:predicted metal-dependent HD superfamily phosphohydrolase